AAGRRPVILQIGSRRGKERFTDRIRLRPILPSRERERPAIELDLILEVKTRLLRRSLRVDEGGKRTGRRHGGAVDRRKHVDWGDKREFVVRGRILALII